MKKNKLKGIILSGLLILSFTGCSPINTNNEEYTTTEKTAETKTLTSNEEENSQEGAHLTSYVENTILDTSDMFTDHDLLQSVDLSGASYIELTSDTEIIIEEEGIYVISGQVSDTTIIVEADDEAKVQLVLDGVDITNENSPVIYVKSGDKVFVTTSESENYMSVSGSYEADGDTNLDSVIFCKSDLVLNGMGILEVISMEGNGITSKDDLKITGGTLNITSSADGLEANDSIRIYDGEITIVSNKDAIHSENDEDSSLGYIYIQNGVLNITASDDAIHGNSIIQIDEGEIYIDTCQEGIEATYIQINGGIIDIYGTDDGINATSLSTHDVTIEVNGGYIDVSMADGDTDAFDANGNIYVNGGTINIEGGSAFDADGVAELNGGDVTLNGEIVTEITQSQMGGKGGTKHR